MKSDGFKRPIEIREQPTLEKTVRRRGVLKGTVLAAAAVPFVASGVKAGAAKSKTIQLAFCSQMLCVPPYEVTRDGGYFRDEGLDVQLLYMRGGTAAMQALVGGAVDYAATSFDDVLQASNRGAEIKWFYSTARLPLLALAIAPNKSGKINSFKDLEGRTIGEVSRGGLAEALTLFLMKKVGAFAGRYAQVPWNGRPNRRSRRQRPEPRHLQRVPHPHTSPCSRARHQGGTVISNPPSSSSQSVSAVNPEAVTEKARTLAAVCGWLGT